MKNTTTLKVSPSSPFHACLRGTNQNHRFAREDSAFEDHQYDKSFDMLHRQGFYDVSIVGYKAVFSHENGSTAIIDHKFGPRVEYRLI